MSEFHVEVVRIGPVEKHPNADTLSITKIHGGYPVIFRTGDYAEGDLAVYVPVDGLVPTDRDPFRFLAREGAPAKPERIKAKRLRGTFSMGLLVPAPEGAALGADVAEWLGVTKWEPPIENLSTAGDAEPPPKGPQIPVYDIEGLRRHPDLLAEGEEVWISEKLHGANARVFHDGERLWVGSRTQWKRADSDKLWWPVMRELGFETLLASYPDLVLFGEVYGQVQDLRYGVAKGARFALFDAWRRNDGTWMNVGELSAFAIEVGIPIVPTIYQGPWSSSLMEHAEGKSALADHVREGFVVKPMVERWSDEIGRVILKMHGEGYLTRKGG